MDRRRILKLGLSVFWSLNLVPTYRLNGPLVHFAAQPKHLSLIVVSLDVMNAFRKEIQDFDAYWSTWATRN